MFQSMTVLQTNTTLPHCMEMIEDVPKEEWDLLPRELGTLNIHDTHSTWSSCLIASYTLHSNTVHTNGRG